MTKVTIETIQEMEITYPVVKEQILRFENAVLPTCSWCGSRDTAHVQIGIVGRTITLCSATTKFKLIPNGPPPGRFFCNACKQFYCPCSSN